MREYENDFNQEYFEGYYETAFDDVETKAEAGEPSVSDCRKGRYYTLSRKTIALLTALCILLSASFGVGGAYLASSSSGNSVTFLTSDRDLSVGPVAAQGGELTVAEIIDKAADAVVEISTEIIQRNMWMGQYVAPGAGSGVIISADGYIMTNNHVVEGSSGKIGVTLSDGTQYEATLIGADPVTDVAIIKIDAKGLTPVVFGDSDKIAMGDLAVAIGNPLGHLGGTATAGIISALDRELTIEGKTMNLLQTDASINRGNSGGGLFDKYGDMIGLVVAKSEGLGVEGLGFAIPINTAKAIATQLVENGYVKGRPMIGITMIDLTSAQEAISRGVRVLGVYVSSVDSETAKKSGLLEGDMLYYIEDVKIEKPSDITDTVQKYAVGDILKLTVVRGDEIIDLEIELIERPANL